MRNEFNFGGIDAVFSMGAPMVVREGFSHYTGLSPALTSYQVPIGQRRVFVVLSGVKGSASHDPWEILYRNSNFTAANAPMVRSLIDSIEGPSVNPLLDYGSWSESFDLPAETAGRDQDPDGDGTPSGVEFLLGLDPTKADVLEGFAIERSEAGNPVLRYREARNRSGSVLALEVSTAPGNWSPFHPHPDAVTRTPLDDYEQIHVDLSRLNLGPTAMFRFLSLAVPSQAPAAGED
ncbi:MAG TPA: hypothetical protein VMN36_00420 [Verrucomicrobiales bacterium]|nr:hypothetical protein [Verrucomicrobiales bacterium]